MIHHLRSSTTHQLPTAGVRADSWTWDLELLSAGHAHAFYLAAGQRENPTESTELMRRSFPNKQRSNKSGNMSKLPQKLRAQTPRHVCLLFLFIHQRPKTEYERERFTYIYSERPWTSVTSRFPDWWSWPVVLLGEASIESPPVR